MKDALSIAFKQDQNLNWDIFFENGSIKMENAVNSAVKHIIFCNGRVSKSLQSIRERRGGFLGNVFNVVSSFSTAWYYYLQNYYTNQTRLLLRDAILTALLQDQTIALVREAGGTVEVNVNILSKNTVAIIVKINSEQFLFEV